MELKQIPRIAYLLAHRLINILSAEESAELKQWTDDEQNRNLSEEINRRGFYSEKKTQENLFDCEAGFRKVRSRYRHQVLRRRLQRICIAGAAVVLFFVAIGWLMTIGREQSEPFQEVVAQFPAGESRAVLVLSNGQRVVLAQQMNDSVIVAPGVKLDVTGKLVEYQQKQTNDPILAYNTLEVPRNGEFRLILSDGTKVWMNSESQIRYPVVFTGKERRVYLHGEAYFEVSKNEKLPFVVDLGEASVKVLGTCFNMKAYEEDGCIYTTLAEGKVQFNMGRQSVILEPEEQGVANIHTGEVVKKKVESRLYSAWKDGRFVFQEQTLGDIMKILMRWYNVQVIFENNALSKLTFSGNLKRYDSFEKIIGMLEMTGMAHFKIKKNTILISE